MIEELLTRDRVILIPTKIPGFTVSELARELNITTSELAKLRVLSCWYSKEAAWRINLPLISLYCSTKFYEPACVGSDPEENAKRTVPTRKIFKSE